MTSHSSWADFYADRVGPGYEDYCRRRYEPFLSEIVSHLPYDGRAIEMGCGTATISNILASYPGRAAAKFSLIDKDPEMIQLARFRTRHNAGRVNLMQLDFRDNIVNSSNLRADVLHSHGVLEHYGDDDIRSIVVKFRKIAPIQVHYVPGLYPKPSFGDERLLPLDHWTRLLDVNHAEAFNWGLDYCLTIRNS